LPIGYFGREYTRKIQFTRILSLSSRWLGTKYSGGGIKSVFIHVASSLTNKRIIDLHDSISAGPLYSIIAGKETKAIRHLDEHFIICIFQKTTTGRIMDSLSSFELSQKMGALTWSSTQAVPADEIPGYTEVYALPNTLAGEEQLWVRNRGGSTIQDQEGRRLTIRGNNIYKPSYGRVGRIRRIPRQVTVHVIDTINSETYFLDKLSTLAAKAKL
jgi:hypothetical protein